MKKLSLLLVLISLFSFSGCKNQDISTNSSQKTYMSSSFNQESYIWESLLFPTNRVMDRR